MLAAQLLMLYDGATVKKVTNELLAYQTSVDFLERHLRVVAEHVACGVEVCPRVADVALARR